jgi:hypothetical protein
MLGIVTACCEFQPDMSRGVVVVESDHGPGNFAAAFEELQNPEARTFAQGYAASRGMAAARINGNIEGPYPINSEGLVLDQVKGPDSKPLPQTHARMQPHRYRVSVPVCQPLR